jgi:hypothetical protein
LFAIDFSPANSRSTAKRAMASPAPMDAEHQQASLPDDVLVHVLEYLCTLNDIAARRWCLNKAWLKAHAAPVHWRTLTLSTGLPLGDEDHCLVSAWERAPRQLRLAVERHTRHVELTEGRDKIPYTLGRGLAGQRFARLQKVTIDVLFATKSLQHYDDDAAALSPLFVAECLVAPFIEWTGRRTRRTLNFLYGQPPRTLYKKFPNLRRLELGDGPDLFLRPDRSGRYSGYSAWYALLASEGVPAGKVETRTLMDREQAAQLIELRSLRLKSVIHVSTPAGLFPHMTLLELWESALPLYQLQTVFARLHAICPVLEILILQLDSEYDTWADESNYSVFAHAPRSLKALVLVLQCTKIPKLTRSKFVALIQRDLPAGVQVHIKIAESGVSWSMEGMKALEPWEDDGALPKGFWEPAQFPEVGEFYDDAVLARASFSEW